MRYSGLLLIPCLALLHVPAAAVESQARDIPLIPESAAFQKVGGPVVDLPLAITQAAPLDANFALPIAPEGLALAQIETPRTVIETAQMPALATLQKPIATPGQAAKTSTLAALEERTAALAQPGAQPENEIPQLYQGKDNSPALTVTSDKSENPKMATVNDAIALATKAHKGQKDKGGADYISHPLRLMAKMSTEEEKMTAVLHDVVEDTPVTLEYLRSAGYPAAVVEALDLLTHRKGESYADYIGRIKQNPLARKVKIADLEDNMDLARLPSPQQKDLDRVEKYRKFWRELTDLEKMDSEAPRFKYYKILSEGETRGLFMFNRSADRLDMVSWNHQSKTWEENPSLVRYFRDSAGDAEEITRDQADQIARGFGAKVPTEKELMSISDQAQSKRRPK